MAFREGESIEMPCEATGEPSPLYKWHMNDKDFDPSGNDGRIAIQPGVGTLIFANPLERDEALYQCFAQNTVGTALTVKIDLRKAILEPFVGQGTRYHQPILGHSLTLRCVPPRSFPKAEHFWATIAEGDGFTPIDLTDRVTMDPEGNLHFAHIIASDAKQGRTYACFVQNQVMRSIQQGEYAVIQPQGQTIQYLPPSILWQSPTHQVALRGETWRVKCIFSGSPTPRVDWRRDGADMPPRSRPESFGQELVIENVQFEDDGKYECEGINDEAMVPIRRSFDLSIEASPYWTPDGKPMSINGAELGKAEFTCQALGKPEPVHFWFLNGVPISQAPADPRRILQGNKLIFHNLTMDDAQVIQCNSTNKHGYIFQNAYLNVLSEPPLIQDPPKEIQRAAEGQTINLTCQVFGSPKPIIVWRKGQEQLTGGRFKVMDEGHLQIEDVSLVDAGMYTCTATNKLGTASATGTLVVRRKTLIQTEPLDIMIYEGTEAKFTCTATTDPEEVVNLRIDWMKDNQMINYALAQRVFKNDMDNSLTISGTISLDTGKYTCVASNGLDQSMASAQLVVQAPPDPPNNVWTRCYNQERYAEVFWQPGKENYAPILNFVVQFNTSFTPDTWYDIANNISQNERMRKVYLSPYGNYTFRALARNKIGMSPPSAHTEVMCSTLPDVPDKNPENVIGEGDLPNNLVIFWTPMPKIEQNAPDFKYIVSWRRADKENAVENVANVQRSDAWHYLVPDIQDTYAPFHIKVKANNAQGDSSVEPVTVLGYSGEAEPNESPSDVYVIPESIKATSAKLTWTQVDTDPENIRGFFRGYRIQFGKTSEWPYNIREQDVIINDPLQYPRPRVKRDLPENVKVTVKYLPPDSDVTLQVRVLNKYYAGPPSSVINFKTSEGEPGPPASLEIVARGSTHFELRWTPPYEENGKLIGYNISYQQITGLNLGRLQYRTPIEDENINQARLTGLMPRTFYRVYLSAATRQGKGEPIFLDMESAPPGAPTPPSFAIVALNETFANITWEPSRTGNPGSVFFVSYRVRGSYEWQHTPDEYLNYYMGLYGLIPGTPYQVRVVAKNGEKHEAPAPWQEFITSGIAPGHFELGSSMWFYGIFIALFLLVMLVVAFYMLKKVTDSRWERKEEEIAEQVRGLQAQEFASGFVEAMGGEVNEYAITESREELAASMDKPSYPTQEYDEDDDAFEQSSRYLPEKRPVEEEYTPSAYPEAYNRYGVAAAAPTVGYHPAYSSSGAGYGTGPQVGYGSATQYDPSAMVRAPTPESVHGAPTYVLPGAKKDDNTDTFV